MATVRHLGFVGSVLGPPSMTSLLGVLYRCAKFGGNRSSSFDNMKVLIFCAFKPNKFSKNQDGGGRHRQKPQKSRYHSNGLIDLREMWHDYAKWVS